MRWLIRRRPSSADFIDSSPTPPPIALPTASSRHGGIGIVKSSRLLRHSGGNLRRISFQVREPLLGSGPSATGLSGPSCLPGLDVTERVAAAIPSRMAAATSASARPHVCCCASGRAMRRARRHGSDIRGRREPCRGAGPEASAAVWLGPHHSTRRSPAGAHCRC